MKRKAILGSAAVLTSAIGVSVVMYAVIINSRTRSAPAQTAQESARSTTNEAPPSGISSGEVSEASEKQTSASVTPAPQQITQPSADASPLPSQTISAALPITNKLNGTWVLDPARSEGLDLSMKQVMIVTQSGGVINVKTTISTAERGDWTVTDTYTLNGRETEFTAQSSEGATVKGIRIARLTNDGNGVEVNERATMEGQGASAKVNTTRRWMLADDKSLIIEMNIQGPNINRHHKRVFVKQ